ACLDVSTRREAAFEKLGNILGFVAAYILGPDPEGRGVPADLVPAVRELRASYTTRQGEMDPALVKRLGLFDYLRARLAVAGTPEDCLEQVRRAEAAGATQLMFTVSLAADPVGTADLSGREALPALRRRVPVDSRLDAPGLAGALSWRIADTRNSHFRKGAPRGHVTAQAHSRRPPFALRRSALQRSRHP